MRKKIRELINAAKLPKPIKKYKREVVEQLAFEFNVAAPIKKSDRIIAEWYKKAEENNWNPRYMPVEYVERWLMATAEERDEFPIRDTISFKARAIKNF